MTELFAKLFGTSPREIIVSIVDVFIVYYAIYRVLLMIKGTRAAQMVFGLVLIGAGFFAANQFELGTVSWLLDNFINYFIIIIIVVFQHDIRRGLVRIGQNLFSFGRTYEETQVFDEVVRAVEHLAKARIGAIIVFEREADLSEFVETGEVLDARVSKELLVALFLPSRDNELHDGAVIVKNLRVQQGGAVLPLSRSPHLARELGTRHRAAIGITEETDAVSVVVSEERGEISLCLAGSMARDLDPGTLRKALLGLFHRAKDDRGSVDEEARAAAATAQAFAAIAAAGEAAKEAGDAEEPPAGASEAEPPRAKVAAQAKDRPATAPGVGALGAHLPPLAPIEDEETPPPAGPVDDVGGDVTEGTPPPLEGGTVEDEWPGGSSGGIKKARPGTEFGS